jgi:uncharacterized coiled-coil protein SlyX
MTSEQYTELIDFLGEKFGKIDQRFDAMDRRFDAMDRRFDRLEGRVTAGAVSLEALRDQVRLLGEAVTATNQRLDRFEVSVNARFDALGDKLDRLHMDHELRLTALEARCPDA